MTDEQHEQRTPRWGRKTVGASFILLAVVGAAALTAVPVPYVYEAPGPVYDTLGSAEGSDGDQHELITVDGVTTYDTEGTLSMLTVSLVGSPEGRPTWFDIFAAWLRPDSAVVPMNVFFPEGTTYEDTQESANFEMESSKREAIAAALSSQGIEYTSYLRVEGTKSDFPSDGVLEVGDVFVSIDGEDVGSSSRISEVIAGVGEGNIAHCVLLRDGTEIEADIPVVFNNDTDQVPVIGVIVSSHYEFPFDVSIRLDDVGGPSAGMMFALGIVDKITPGYLNGGHNVAGTGTITAEGVVGGIGGIVQKMYGARYAGVEYFLVPASNCDEVTGNVPDGLQVFAVEDLGDALSVLNAIEADSDLSVLPACD